MLDIKMQFKKGILVIKLRGNLTSDTSYILENEFNKVINKSGGKYVFLNIKNIDIIDKFGVKIVKKCYTKVINNNGKFIIYGMDEIFNNYVKSNHNLYQVNEEHTVYGIVKL